MKISIEKFEISSNSVRLTRFHTKEDLQLGLSVTECFLNSQLPYPNHYFLNIDLQNAPWKSTYVSATIWEWQRKVTNNQRLKKKTNNNSRPNLHKVWSFVADAHLWKTVRCWWHRTLPSLSVALHLATIVDYDPSQLNTPSISTRIGNMVATCQTSPSCLQDAFCLFHC